MSEDESNSDSGTRTHSNSSKCSDSDDCRSFSKYPTVFYATRTHAQISQGKRSLVMFK